MDMRQRYGNPELDQIFCYFMRTALRIQKSGVEELPIAFDAEEPVKRYMRLAMELLIDGQCPEISNLILQSEYDDILKSFDLSLSQIMQLQLIKDISQHIHYDKDCFAYLLSTSGLWQDKANEYATKTFYGNLPSEKYYQEKEILKYIPEEMLELDNF